MRTVSFAILPVMLMFVSTAPGHAQLTGDLRRSISFAPNAIRTATVSKNGVTLASVEVPRGNFLRVSYDNTQANAALIPQANGVVFVLDHTARLDLHGDVALRVLTREQFNQLGPNVSVADAMADAPLVFNAQGVDVLITGRDE